MNYQWRPGRASARTSPARLFAHIEQTHQKWWKLLGTSMETADTFSFRYFPGDPDEDALDHAVFSTKYGLKVVSSIATETAEEGNVVVLSGKASNEMLLRLSSLPKYYYFPRAPIFDIRLFRGADSVFYSGDFGSDVFLELDEATMAKLEMDGFSHGEFIPIS